MNLADRDGFIWQDGKLIDWRDAKIHVLTHTLHYSMGVFEGVRAYETPKGTAIFRLQDHTKRLLNSAKIYQMKVPYDQATLEQAQIDVVRENKLASCYLRPLIWIGSEKLGIAATNNTIHAAVAAWAWGAYLGDEAMAKGIRVKTSSFTHHHPNVTMCKAKHLVTTRYQFLLTKKLLTLVTMKQCSWTHKVMSAKVQVKTYS